MSDIAIRLKRTLHWDPRKECFKNDDNLMVAGGYTGSVTITLGPSASE